jgi:hypothetical protein
VVTAVAGVGIGLELIRPSAYTTAVSGRDTTTTIADDTNDALLGLFVASSIKKNQQSQLVEITNNAGQSLTLTVSLDNPAQGSLTGPLGTGSAVTVPLGIGQTATVDCISNEPASTTVPFTIAHSSPELSFTIHRQTVVATGNTPGEVSIDKLQQFGTDAGADIWTIKTLEASSTNFNLDRVELAVRESGTGTVVATETFANINATQFVRSGTGNSPGITLQPDTAGYDVSPTLAYDLTVTAIDTAGNFDTAAA